MQIELTQTQFGPDASCLLALNKQSPTHRDVFPRGSGPSRHTEPYVSVGSGGNVSNK